MKDNDTLYELPPEESEAVQNRLPGQTSESSVATTEGHDLRSSLEDYRLPEDDGDDAELSDDEDIDAEELFPSPDNESGGHRKHLPALLMMLRTLLTPVEGWKSIRRSRISPEKFSSECFYPLIALASVSVFAVKLYGAVDPLDSLLISALRVFISFFIGYFAILLAVRIVVPGGRAVFDSSFGKVFIMNALSSLALFYSLLMALPMIEPLLVFLPLWTIYAVCRGERFLRIPSEHSTLATCLLCLLIVGMPLMVGWVISFFLPSPAAS